MATMSVVSAGGQTLTYDTDDVETVEFSTTAPPLTDDKQLNLKVTFKDGKRPVWIEE